MLAYRCCGCGTEYPSRLEWCHACRLVDYIVPASRRPGRSDVLRGGRLNRATARELAAAAWTMMEGCYPIRLLKGAFIAIYGPPGSGKSTMLARWLNGIDGAVALLAVEEGLGPALSERLARLCVRRSDFHILSGGGVDQVAAELAGMRVRALGVDSLSVGQLLPRELRRLQEASKVPLVFGTLQVTKDGRAAGTNAWLHEADVVVSVEGLAWTVEKTRYGAAGESGRVLEEGS